MVLIQLVTNYFSNTLFDNILYFSLYLFTSLTINFLCNCLAHFSLQSKLKPQVYRSLVLNAPHDESFAY